MATAIDIDHFNLRIRTPKAEREESDEELGFEAANRREAERLHQRVTGCVNMCLCCIVSMSVLVVGSRITSFFTT